VSFELSHFKRKHSKELGDRTLPTMAAKKDKKDKKAKAAEKKTRVAQKQEKKATKSEKKQKLKGKNDDDSDAEDVDLDAVLAEYARQQEQFLKVTETVCEPPSPRGSATLLGSPSNDNELFLFGGEYFNGALAHFFNDLYIYNITRDEWKKVTSPNTPLPRSGHAWCRGGNAGGIYLFGGEFSSPKQGTFYHYNDFWRLDPQSREWTRLESKGKGPPARSGHRMTYYKNYVVLFGGFQDTSQQTKYLQDLWVYDCTTFVWHEGKPPLASAKPDARSSFSLLPHESGAVLYGGYSRVKAATLTGGKNVKGGGPSRQVMKPLVHQDTWFLRIIAPAAEAASNTPPNVRWERRKRPANAPNPARAGATMCAHKGRGIQFGGVHDVEESEEGIDSEFFNTLFTWNVDRNRYFPLALRRPKAGKKAVVDRGGRRDRGKQAEEELFANLRALELKDGGGDALTAIPGAEVDDAPDRPEKPVMWEMPHPRFNAQLTVQDDVLYLFGGTFEKGDREFTFDEMWAIDLGKLDGVKEIFKRDLDDWQGSESEEDSEDEGDDSDDEEADSEDEASTAATSIPEAPEAIPAKEIEDDTPEEPTTARVDEGLPHPRPFESLRDFFERAKIQWQELVLDELSKKGQGERSIKEVRKKAFERAEEKWWDCREEILALEDEQTEAGIGDVVSLAEKNAGEGGGGGGVGRRR
jgi:N-acetylneuraminic acid mutarotase